MSKQKPIVKRVYVLVSYLGDECTIEKVFSSKDHAEKIRNRMNKRIGGGVLSFHIVTKKLDR